MAALQLLHFLNLELLNIRGAERNLSQLCHDISELKTITDIIALTETHLGLDETIHVPNYTCWSNPEFKGVGGTVFLIHNRIMPVCVAATVRH